MNIIVGAVIIAITVLAVVWLAGKFCMHKYEIIDTQDHGFGADVNWPTERTYVTRCVKCGKICTKNQLPTGVKTREFGETRTHS